MTNPLSITASVIAIVTIAYSSCKTLYETVKDIRDAPKTFVDLTAHVDALQQVLSSLSTKLDEDSKSDNLSAAQRPCPIELKAPLEACADACKQFQSKLDKVMSHSSNGHTSFRDRVRLQFQDKEITAFRHKLGSYKSTLNIALGMASLQTTDQSTDATKDLEVTIEKTMDRLSGQIQGMDISMQAVIAASAEHQQAPKQELMQTMEQQNGAIAACLRFCVTALSSTTQSTGNTFKYVRTFNDARQLVGNIGNVTAEGPASTFDVLIAQDRAKQMAGSIEGTIALGVMNAPSVQSTGRGPASFEIPLPPMPR